MEKREIELLHLETGLLWPHYQKKKAWSASSLTKILKEIEYGEKEIPVHVLKIAAENGKIFHQTIQTFIKTGKEDFAPANSFSVNRKVKETISFLKNNNLLNFDHFLGGEKLHYVFHKSELFATYIDLEFEDYVIELKTNNVIINESPISLLIFEVQLLIQYLCTGKSVYLLWSTGQGVIFKKFQVSTSLLEILDILLDLVQNTESYSFEKKKEIVQEIIKNYPQKKLM